MSKSKVLVTGATGMVGFAVLTATLEAGYRARVAVRKPEDFERLKGLAPVDRYQDQVEAVVVPDITTSGAYDTAVQNVEYIIHVASPVAVPPIDNYQTELVEPARKGTLRILESATKEPQIKRVVFTASSVSVIPANAMMAGQEDVVYDGKNRVFPLPTGPYGNIFEGYMASKVIALKEAEDFIHSRHPSFDIISIGPGFVIGRDRTVTEVAKITKGSNDIAFSQLLGKASPSPFASIFSHIDDVALLHVKALDPAIRGNQYFLATAECPNGPNWADAAEIIRKHYPKEVSEGLFDLSNLTPTIPVKTDSSYTETIFGLTFKSYEQAIVSVADHYLELTQKRVEL